MSTTVEAPTSAGPDVCDDNPEACDWVCDQDASCTLQPSTTGRKRNRLVTRFDDEWVDLTGWRQAHPAGDHWIDLFDKTDATEVMHAFHSEDAHKMLSRLPRARQEDIPTGKDAPDDVTPHTRAFRALRVKLEKEGWFKRKPLMEAGTLSMWVLTMTAAVASARMGHPLLSALMLAVSNTSAGWIAHDYIHGRGRWCTFMAGFGELGGGMSRTWWSDKHNLHHALTNVVGVDEDLMVDPALFLWAPDPKDDSPARKFQHLYWALPYSLLFAIWRVDSVVVAFKRKLWGELSRLVAHYAIALSLFPVKVLLPALFLSGLLTAVIVTVSHTAEELFTDGPHEKDYVESQFLSTRDFTCSNPVFEYLAGGMNYQLEHHLFPTMPRYYYPKLVPIIKQWAEEQGLEYRVDTDVGILKRCLSMLKRVAKAPAETGALGSRDLNLVGTAASRS